MNDDVLHRVWGRGRVIRERRFHTECEVEFERGFTMWVRRTDLTFLSETQEQRPASTLSVKPRVRGTEPISSRRIIEAVRLGIVPARYIEEFTYGREKELEEMDSWLKTQGGVLYFIGQYGAGKTHMLRVLRQKGLRSGYVVCTANIDALEASFHKPKSVYSQVINSLRFQARNGKRSTGDIRSLLHMAADNPQVKKKLHEYPSIRRVMAMIGPFDYRKRAYPPEAWYCLQWFRGRTPSTLFRPGMYDDGTAANIYCNILNGLCTTSEMMGFKGLLLILDEAENIDASWLTDNQRLRSDNFCRGLHFLAFNDLRLMNEDIEIIRDLTPLGKSTGLSYHRFCPEIRYAPSLPANLKIAFAFTTMPSTESIGGQPTTVELGELPRDIEEPMTEGVSSSYADAYQITVSEKVRSEIRARLMHLRSSHQASYRTAVKAVVELLDFVRFYPAERLPDR